MRFGIKEKKKKSDCIVWMLMRHIYLKQLIKDLGKKVWTQDARWLI